MATLKAYSIRDNKMSTYTAPFFVVDEIQALRLFERVCMDESLNYWRNPGDFDLFEVGNFNDDSGKMDSTADNKFIMSAMQSIRNSLMKMKEMQLPEEILKKSSVVETETGSPEHMGE